MTSASAKVPLLTAIEGELRQHFPDSEVVAGDTDDLCLAARVWPSFLRLPPTEDAAIDAFIDLLRSHGVTIVFPTRDGELALLARQRDRISEAGIAVMVSRPDAIDRCLDKARFASTLVTAGLPAIPTASRIDELTEAAEYVVKERTGAGSQGLGLRLSRSAAAAAGARLKDPVFQPFVSGREFSIDAYRSRDGRTLGFVARSRDLVRHGESQVTTTVDPAPFGDLVTATLDALEIEGHALLQVLVDDERVSIIECNPRFGGASTLSMAAGLTSASWFACEARGTDPGSLPFTPLPTPLQLVRTPVDEFRDPRP
jgi:carbamoyl-phosphate synthase large subunit